MFGIVPFVIISLSGLSWHQLPFSFSPGKSAFLYTAILGFVLVGLNLVNRKSVINLETYPAIRNAVWTPPLLVLSAFTWILYLLGYEIMFRGFLLFPAIELIGLWPAIILNVALYSLVHIPKGITEAIGAIPLGIILSWMAYSTGSFWVAFFIHVILALSNEWISFYHHPGMSLVCPLRSKRK